MDRLLVRALLPAACGVLLLCAPARTQAAPQNSQTPSASQSQPQAPQKDQAAATASALPRGKQLVLKDGSSEIVSSYSIVADRVRYYSIERSQWEEIPSALVDWDATHRAEAAQAQSQAQQLAAVGKREREREAETVDVDASYEVAPGVFLPTELGMFLVQDKTPVVLNSVNPDVKNDKGRKVAQMVFPMPVIPSRRHLQLKGSRATLRVHTRQPEFYLRVAGNDQPQVELLRLRVHGDTRAIEDVDSLWDQSSAVKQIVSLETWKTAEGLYRFTMSKPLAPGEYALTELPAGKQGANILVWDFGVDPGSNSKN
jgi:hypothetical protein